MSLIGIAIYLIELREKKRKVFTVRLDETKIKDIKLLSIDTDKSIGGLLEEAIEDLIIKYGRSAVYFQTKIPEDGKKNPK